MPHMAIIILNERFIDWEQPDRYGLPHAMRAVDAIIGTLHLIPSNLDVSQVLTNDIVT